MAAHWGGGGDRRSPPNLKDSWQASRAPKVILHGQHPISFGTSMPSLTHLLSLQITSLSALLIFPSSFAPLHRRFPRERHPRLVVDHYRPDIPSCIRGANATRVTGRIRDRKFGRLVDSMLLDHRVSRHFLNPDERYISDERSHHFLFLSRFQSIDDIRTDEIFEQEFPFPREDRAYEEDDEL